MVNTPESAMRMKILVILLRQLLYYERDENQTGIVHKPEKQLLAPLHKTTRGMVVFCFFLYMRKSHFESGFQIDRYFFE